MVDAVDVGDPKLLREALGFIKSMPVGQQIPHEVVLRWASKHGVSDHHLRRAKKILQVKTVKRMGMWCWEIPAWNQGVA